jgi:GPH family glycoside/pentoside/hexuronide:cation symporter
MKLKTNLMYSSLLLGANLISQISVTWYAAYYAPSSGNGFISVSLAGYAMLIARIIDAVADIPVAYWSDNATFKSGRRMPFIKYGALPMIMCFILMWFPIAGGSIMTNFVYITAVMSGFVFLYTLVVAPYLALLPEIAETPDERIKITTYQSVFTVIALLLGTTVAGLIINSYGYRTMGVVMGLVALPFTLLPVFAIKEKQHQKTGDEPDLFRSIWLTLKNKNYLFFQITNLLVSFVTNMLIIAFPFIGGVLLGLSAAGSGLLLGATMLVAVASFPLIVRATNRYGKKRVYGASILLMGFMLGLLFFVGRPLLFFDQPWFGYALLILSGVPMSSMLIMPNAFVADITDEDAAKTGQRREAMYYGVAGLLTAAFIGVSSWYTLSILFNYFGYNVGSPLGIYLIAPSSSIICVIAYAVLKKGYRLDEREVIELKKDKS